MVLIFLNQRGEGDITPPFEQFTEEYTYVYYYVEKYCKSCVMRFDFIIKNECVLFYIIAKQFVVEQNIYLRMCVENEGQGY